MVNVTIALTEQEIQSLNLIAVNKGMEVAELLKTSALLSASESKLSEPQTNSTETRHPLSKAMTQLMNEYGLV